jgi:hypothetical protein
LLFTPYASEGTRTGFYTDEYEEQFFKHAEEIRSITSTSISSTCAARATHRTRPNTSAAAGQFWNSPPRLESSVQLKRRFPNARESQ